MMLGLMIKFKGYLVAVGAVLVTITAIFLKGKSAGRQQEVQKQQEANNEAKKRMDAVKPATPDSTTDS